MDWKNSSNGLDLHQHQVANYQIHPVFTIDRHPTIQQWQGELPLMINPSKSEFSA